ncbi:pimeloyl-CoA dehydrogenase small subunit [Alcanivorax sp. HI0033]|uniref:acyl-CoA dehydrogenase family protein n=1 Tax=unclassified Alcanivorax TaxID=2638842 RepID=UPI0007BA5723|nr:MULTISPECIES: acyl-CoA dehydrogenase [unclassified Alcanivorax]KZX74439.1 pimeloyl-CoA dehydrogenase small subunit [Alcanivorax sp. HI0013]KZX78756.1 pimeloyl-CoA dehydrogenase small subunit [Alcanivorax sp. HI0011]KZY18319.1 pimeloyl-CoA dehydrogenase small subunit [Alcanivorax sp. HI0035]KZX63518.1 pimeloyl-CoA dehydrogenase small subunit [Alcanivorax sp. HI0003]KZX66968.1 pimeloyl-CoA dehydrogenase small subunit [Alcanivorax sp. HI0007]
MDFKLSDEQRMLEETVGRLVRDGYPFDVREKARTSELGFSKEMWQQFAELGLLGVPFSEDFGGFNGGGPELMVVAEGFGRGLVLEPYLATVVLSGTLINALASDSQKEALISAIVGGELRLALAAYEPEGRYDHTHVATTAEKSGDSYVISGSKAVVLHGDSADKLVVIARTAGNANDRNGLSAFVVDAAAEGVSRRGYETIDGLHAAEISLNKAPAELLGEEGNAIDALEKSLALGIVALCAEATGAMEVACDHTLNYIKERQQFGVPIGKFQALQHRMVEMRMELEKARSMTILAACSLELSAPVCAKRLAAAKAIIGKSGRKVAEEAIQLHGGMGMMEETAVSHYAKRIVMIDHQLGDLGYHMQQLENLLDVDEDAA